MSGLLVLGGGLADGLALYLFVALFYPEKLQ